MLTHRNSYSVGSTPAAYGFRSAAPSQPTRTPTASVRESHSAEYEVQRPFMMMIADVRHLGQYTL
jgi:hypothetical protein